MASRDLYKNLQAGIAGPIEHASAISPDDAVDLDWVTRSIMVETEGDVAGILKGGSTVFLKSLKPGVLYPFRFCRVTTTGTTATGIVGLW